MNMHGGTALPIGFHRDRSHHHDVSRDTVGRLTFGVVVGHCGSGAVGFERYWVTVGLGQLGLSGSESLWDWGSWV